MTYTPLKYNAVGKFRIIYAVLVLLLLSGRFPDGDRFITNKKAKLVSRDHYVKNYSGNPLVSDLKTAFAVKKKLFPVFNIAC